MPIEMIRVDVDALDGFVRRAFLAMGLSQREADLCAAGLMQSELRCLPGQGQGVARLTGYYDRISKGLYQPGTSISVIKESPALALIDANMAMGSVVGQDAMQIAMDKAKDCGIGAAFVYNSTHFGSSGFHARRALEADCIGSAITNAGAEMAPWGGREPRVGTNPWGLAAPTGGDFPVVLDIALTTAGKGMMRWHEREGYKMPRDWALTPDGYETDEPTAAMAGALLGIGEYKGYGLSLFTDVLTGLISGGGFGLAPYQDRSIAKLDVAHTFIAIDIEWFMPVEEFKARMDTFIAEIKSSALRPGFDEILVPGEIDHRRERQYRRAGAQLDADVYESLRQLAEPLGIDFDI
ncbi:MAG: Ldh family oxidoreductase [Chloroflexi bacterium]|nr:Ldh family oxidoreductase [Chloroflexota bacterium]